MSLTVGVELVFVSVIYCIQIFNGFDFSFR